jgi:hypothetical protein
MPDVYNNITLGDIVSELELRRQSLHIYNNTLKGVPTGNIAADGTAEYLITELNGGTVDVKVQDLTTDWLSLYVGEQLGLTTDLIGADKEATTFDIVTDGTVPIVGNFLCMQEVGKVTQTEITSVVLVSGNRYTVIINVPLDYDYTTAGACAILNVDFNLNGSITPIEYKVGPKAGTTWHIYRIMMAMVLTTSGDDGKFGNLAALTNGMYFRKEANGDSKNYFLAKDNSDLRLEGYDVAYPLRSGGGGDFGMAARITNQKSGVAISLDGDHTELYKIVNRDDLTGISKFRIKIQGHVTD